jgi:Tfp pilus assembly protein PilO
MANMAIDFKQMARRLGVPGWAGVAALLAAVVLLLVGQRLALQGEQFEARADTLAKAQRRAVALGPQAAPVTQAQWQQNLPPSGERQQRLADLLEMSLRLGLNSARTEHRLSVDPASGLERLRVSMPLSGSYAQLRQFIGSALAHDPALSLDSLKLRRASPQATEVDAELVWSLHSRMEAPR